MNSSNASYSPYKWFRVPVLHHRNFLSHEVVPEPGWFFRMQVAMTPVSMFFLWPAPRIVDMDFWCLLFNECVGFLADAAR